MIAFVLAAKGCARPGDAGEFVKLNSCEGELGGDESRGSRQGEDGGEDQLIEGERERASPAHVESIPRGNTTLRSGLLYDGLQIQLLPFFLRQTHWYATGGSELSTEMLRFGFDIDLPR